MPQVNTDVLREYHPGRDRFGDDGYPVEWHTTVKHLVRQLAGHRCIRCHHPFIVGTDGEWSRCDEHCDHGGPFQIRARGDFVWTEYNGGGEAQTLREGDPPLELEARWRVLTVHHFDGVKANCRWWNLGALCQRCHLSVQTRVIMEREWHHEHTAWFRPYVAGYYAYSLLGQDLSREQTEERLEELLTLQHRQLRLEGPASVRPTG